MSGISLESKGAEYLIQVSQDLSLAHSFQDIRSIASKAAREICGADGATIVMREGDLCSYVDEDAISPLWKGRKFPITSCVSGWSMIHREAIVIEDILVDPRVPQDAYRPTFVRSLVMVPIRESDPIGAIGNYWSHRHRAPEACVILLRSLANLVAIAIENVKLISQLERTNEELRESLRARDEFLSLASHELRTPLSSLSLQIQALDRKLRAHPDEKLQSGIDLSLRQARNLETLIGNLLDVSKIRLQRMHLNATPLDLTKLTRDAVDLCAARSPEFRGEVRLDLQHGVHGEWDEARLRQIVTNLVSNACKFAPNGPVEVTLKENHGLAMLAVADSGAGISPENQARIFERFGRASTDDHVGGLGLGLFITKRLVEAHRGRIYLESEAGRGAKFTVELPLRA